MSRPDDTETTSTPLSELEGLLVAYTASMLGDLGSPSAEVVDRLRELGAPRWLLENIRRGVGSWTVSDDDRVDVIVGYAAKRARASERIVERDVEQLCAVGLTDFDVVDLNNIVAYYS
jgi:uncharacterized protein YciW